ncbi:MAG TPA: hypothetical protein VJC03_00065, partial [bacterium]|nr:hypothetical protein [bacterium]
KTLVILRDSLLQLMEEDAKVYENFIKQRDASSVRKIYAVSEDMLVKQARGCRIALEILPMVYLPIKVDVLAGLSFLLSASTASLKLAQNNLALLPESERKGKKRYFFLKNRIRQLKTLKNRFEKIY